MVLWKQHWWSCRGCSETTSEGPDRPSGEALELRVGGQTGAGDDGEVREKRHSSPKEVRELSSYSGNCKSFTRVETKDVSEHWCWVVSRCQPQRASWGVLRTLDLICDLLIWFVYLKAHSGCNVYNDLEAGRMVSGQDRVALQERMVVLDPVRWWNGHEVEESKSQDLVSQW